MGSIRFMCNCPCNLCEMVLMSRQQISPITCFAYCLNIRYSQHFATRKTFVNRKMLQTLFSFSQYVTNQQKLNRIFVKRLDILLVYRKTLNK